MAETPFVGVWDTDAIAPTEQILGALEKLRNNDTVMSFPYNGQFYSTDRISCDLFKHFLNIEILLKRISVMNLMHGYHSVGGAFLVNKAGYLKAGGENESFYGWGPEDTERVKRLEIKGLKIHYQPGVMFHLNHPIGRNSWFADSNVERNNRRELQKTCKTIFS
jgi:predicted glycosyltransferase involved in capsule biosynthesis